MGWQVGSSCYADQAAAAAASASSHVGQVVQQGGSAYVVDVVASAAASITYKLTPFDTGLQAITLQAPYTPQPCGLLEWSDGLLLGWGVAAAWLATAAVMFLRRGVHDS